MAFGQTKVIAFYSWGVAPGYGEKGLRPKENLVMACRQGKNGYAP